LSIFIRIMAYVLFWCKDRLPVMHTGVSIEQRRIPTAEPLTLHVMLFYMFIIRGYPTMRNNGIFSFSSMKSFIKTKAAIPTLCKLCFLTTFPFSHSLNVNYLWRDHNVMSHTSDLHVDLCCRARHSEMRIHVTPSEDCVVVRGILSYAYM